MSYKTTIEIDDNLILILRAIQAHHKKVDDYKPSLETIIIQAIVYWTGSDENKAIISKLNKDLDQWMQTNTKN